jgi:SAM-dependent methyltransferase
MAQECSAKDFWSDRKEAYGRTSSNATLFRFFGQLGFEFTGKKVLEIGFGFGADLLEAQRRGAHVHGLDISPLALESFQAREGLSTVRVGDVTAEPIGFGGAFDAIYSNDTIYYFCDSDLVRFARHCFDALKPDGRLVVQFIQGSFARDGDGMSSARPVELSHWRDIHGVLHQDNPIRLLDPDKVVAILAEVGFQLVGKKTVWETYGIREEVMQCSRFLAFSRQ